MKNDLKALKRRGFDNSSKADESNAYRVGCTQCQALVINGVACHESGCPNGRKRQSEDS